MSVAWNRWAPNFNQIILVDIPPRDILLVDLPQGGERQPVALMKALQRHPVALEIHKQGSINCH